MRNNDRLQSACQEMSPTGLPSVSLQERAPEAGPHAKSARSPFLVFSYGTRT